MYALRSVDPNFAEPGPLLDVASAAEDHGWDGFFLWDHILVDRTEPVPVSEPWTVLAAVATATDTLRLGTLVTPVARRRPWVLARQVTTVDHLSGGRAVLGVGLGVPAESEYAAFGGSGGTAPPRRPARRGPRDHRFAVEWRPGVARRPDTSHRRRPIRAHSTPTTARPVWVACSLPARAGIRRAARWDGIAPMYASDDEMRPATPEEVADVVATIAECRGTTDGFEVVVWSVDCGDTSLPAYAGAGATWLIDGPAPGAQWLDDALEIACAGPPD
jgi:alkanesulfonate monooxygenase SsuD/methylene tetrahydromethanopterin reductase-like flavin-dependent oxidoreductase (luciferase family)